MGYAAAALESWTKHSLTKIKWIKNAINTPAVNTTAVIGIVTARRALRITPPYADLPTLAEHR